jgi:hypothetical protein
MDDKTEEQAAKWDILYREIRTLLLHFGTESFRRTADCWVDDDNLGTKQQKIYIRNLALLRPEVIKTLQLLLTDLPDWEIIIAVSVPERGETWPDMGLTIRAHEIVDGLQRQYFPSEFQNFEYPSSRPGTDRD